MAFLDETGLAELWKLIKAADSNLAAADVKLAVGSYTGTGKYGKNNPTRLTVGFAPKFVLITEEELIRTTAIYNYGTVMLVYGMSQFIGTYERYDEGYEEWFDETLYNIVTWENNGISWYFTPGTGWGYEGYDEVDSAQLNESGRKYHSVAIG